jgi:hypothetical protein
MRGKEARRTMPGVTTKVVAAVGADLCWSLHSRAVEIWTTTAAATTTREIKALLQ